MSDTDRLVIHVGPPRTGTTSLQFGAFARHPEIETLGKPFNVEGAPDEACEAMASLCESLWKEDGVAFDFERARALLVRAMDRPARRATVRVLSEEGFGHGGAVDRMVIARRLRRLFGRCRVLVTVRDPVDAAASYHGWAYARGFVGEGIDAWVRSCTRANHYDGRARDFPLSNAKFGELVACYARLFGDERVLVLGLEMLRNDPGAYAGRLAGFIGVDAEQMRGVIAGEPRNTRIGRLDAAYQRLVKRVEYAGARWSGRLYEGRPPSRLVTDGVHGLVRGVIHRFDRPLPMMSDETRARLEEYYAADQALLRGYTGA